MGGARYWLIVAPLAAWTALPAPAADDIGNTGLALDQALSVGRLFGELRPRYNRIDESDKPLLTDAFTMRATLGWKSGAWKGLRLTVEGIYANHLGPRRFSDEFDPTDPYPLLPDPKHAGLNQAHVEYVSEEGALRLKLGRQVVRLNNQRWVSDNDFRQIPQLFDGVTASYAALPNAELSAGYYRKIRDTSGNLEHLKLTILNAAWNPLPGQALAAYGVYHDQPQTANFTGFANNSYKVLGVRMEGSIFPACPIDVPYLLEAARQKPYAGGDPRIDASYWRVGAGVAGRDWTLRLDQETKGSNDGLYGLQNPLTDFYAFNGWSLRFFTTPRVGLRDRWFTGRYARGAWTFFGEEHRFRSDYGSADYGRETDVGITWEALPNLVVRAQHARYTPAPQSTLSRLHKTWITASYLF